MLCKWSFGLQSNINRAPLNQNVNKQQIEGVTKPSTLLAFKPLLEPFLRHAKLFGKCTCIWCNNAERNRNMVRYNSIVSSRGIGNLRKKKKNTKKIYFKNDLFVASVFKIVRLFITTLGDSCFRKSSRNR